MAMEKGLCIGSMAVAGLMLLVFLLDLFAGIPFSKGAGNGLSSPFMFVDIGGAAAAAIVGYLGYNALRDFSK